jgi:hypothetical protein
MRKIDYRLSTPQSPTPPDQRMTFAWPIEDGPERSVSGGTCAEVVERMWAMGDDVRGYLKAKLDRIETPETSSATPQSQVTYPQIELKPGSEIIGYRPGSMNQ